MDVNELLLTTRESYIKQEGKVGNWKTETNIKINSALYI